MKLIFVFILFSFQVCIFAQDSKDLLAGIQNKFRSLEDFTADFKQTTTSIIDNSKIRTEGKFYYKKSDSFCIELKRYLIISDGKTIWNYDNKLNRVVINDMENDPSSFSLQKYILEYPSQCKLETIENLEGNESFYILKLVSSNGDLGFSTAKIFSDKDFMVRKIEFKDESNNLYLVELSDIKPNTNLNESFFDFNPPEGTHIVDLR